MIRHPVVALIVGASSWSVLGVATARAAPPGAVAVASGVSAGARDTVRGRVTDDAGRPVMGAEVGLSELGVETRTDSAGAWMLADIPSGRYTLVVRRLGYAPAARTIQVTAALDAQTVTLRQTPFLIEPVTVTATRSALDPMSSPLPAASLTEESLRREHEVSLARAIERVPGVRSVSADGMPLSGSQPCSR